MSFPDQHNGVTLAAEAPPSIVTGSAAPSQALVVSIHDVAPGTRDTVARMLEELATRGVSVCSLLVVPNYHHMLHSMDDPQFCEWLRELQSAGHEIVVHGYFHERAARAG